MEWRERVGKDMIRAGLRYDDVWVKCRWQRAMQEGLFSQKTCLPPLMGKMALKSICAYMQLVDSLYTISIQPPSADKMSFVWNKACE